MRYLFLSLILILTSCSLNNNSAYWNKDSLNKSSDNKDLSKVISKTKDFKIMTFEEFDLFLKDYSKKAEYPDIND